MKKGKKQGMKLWMKVIIGMFFGIIFGILLGEKATIIKPIGDLFINAIKMLIVPLIFSSLFVGVTSINDPAKMGRIGAKSIIFYLLTTAVAISLGLAMGKILPAGVELARQMPTDIITKTEPSLIDVFVDIIPKNPIDSLAKGHVLQIIAFSLFLGISTSLIGEKGKSLIKLMDSVAEAMYKLTEIVMDFAPYGVFALMAWVAGTFGASVLMPLLKVILGVYIACIIQVYVVMGGALRFLSNLNPIPFFKGIIDAQAVAFSTTSSSGTLPVTMRCAQENLGVSSSVASFVLPLGATVNMNGTAIYQGVCVLFVANVYGVDLSFGNYVTIIITATLASIGTAGIPGAGLIMLSLILNSVGLPIEGVALIAGIDRILDMARTSVNVTGDAFCAVLIAKSENEFDLKTYNHNPEV